MAWLSGYLKRKVITLTGGSSGAQTDYQLKLAVSYAAAMQGDFDDLRFTQADGETLVDAWAEVIVTDTSATVWVEFPTTPANTVEQTYYMYYGNSGVASDWDGDATFEFFDDFDICDPTASRNAGSDMGFPGALPRVVVADNGNWLIVYRARTDESAPSGHDGQVWIRTSTDDGETWGSSTKLSSDVYDAINADFVKYPNGDIDIFYSRYDNLTSTYHEPNMVARSTDDGATWGSFVTAPTPLDTDYQLVWQDIIIGTDVYMSAHDRIITSGAHNTNFYKTTNNGSTWTKISNITSQAADGGYGEGGLVYLGSGEFVCVLRSTDGQGHTLQKRSTDWGGTWSVDGYIKDDGSVAASGVGTDVQLHQNRIWNEDIGGNDLGYIYMQSNLYPGGYPRDMYAYFSIDDCVSWGSRSAIYTASDCHDSELVLKSATSAKYYPGQISGEGNITDDDIIILRGGAPSGWTTQLGSPSTSGGELLLDNAGISRDIAFPANYSVRLKSKYSTAYNTARFMLLDDTWDPTNHSGPYMGWRYGDIMNYDGAWHDGGDYATDDYDIIELRNVDDASHTFDLMVNDVLGVSATSYRNNHNMTTIGLNCGVAGGFTSDWILVRKYATNPATYAFGAEEGAPISIPVMMRYYRNMRES